MVGKQVILMRDINKGTWMHEFYKFELAKITGDDGRYIITSLDGRRTSRGIIIGMHVQLLDTQAAKVLYGKS